MRAIAARRADPSPRGWVAEPGHGPGDAAQRQADHGYTAAIYTVRAHAQVVVAELGEHFAPRNLGGVIALDVAAGVGVPMPGERQKTHVLAGTVVVQGGR